MRPLPYSLLLLAVVLGVSTLAACGGDHPRPIPTPPPVDNHPTWPRDRCGEHYEPGTVSPNDEHPDQPCQ